MAKVIKHKILVMLSLHTLTVFLGLLCISNGFLVELRMDVSSISLRKSHQCSPPPRSLQGFDTRRVNFGSRGRNRGIYLSDGDKNDSKEDDFTSEELGSPSSPPPPPPPPPSTQPGSIFQQRELEPDAVEQRLNELRTEDDPKQTRVIIYIILSLIPVLFLVPLMLGSR